VGVGEALQFAFVTFTAIFFVVDPFAAVPIFLTITGEDTPAQRRATALRAALATWATLTAFGIAGGLIFRMLGISLGAFQIAGGLMLLLMAVDMMRATPSRTRSTLEEQAEARAEGEVAIVPLAIPMLAGPGAIATVMVLMKRAGWRPVPTLIVLGAVALTAVLAYVILRAAATARRFISQTTLHVLERVMGLLLSAIAVEFVVSGLRDLWPALR
jgi:multiple antibiotic resistance protein